MRKKVIESHSVEPVGEPGGEWLDLERIASVEVTSEDPEFPIESVFASEDGAGWRASRPGEQRVRLIFDEPVSVRRVHLRFEETQSSRTQEIVLRWAPSQSTPAREIVRQQWNFSPQGATTEVEDYKMNLDSVGVLELAIQPDVSAGKALAVLQSWRVG